VPAKADAWMPLWIGAYLADTQMLTTEQHGAYLLLLMAYWREGKALPDDDEALRSIAKADRAAWKRLRPTLARFFKVGDGGWWHKRVEAEMASAEKRRFGAVEKAKAAAQARWEQERRDAPSNAPSMPEAMHAPCPTPSPSPSYSKSGSTHPKSFRELNEEHARRQFEEMTGQRHPGTVIDMEPTHARLTRG